MSRRQTLIDGVIFATKKIPYDDIHNGNDKKGTKIPERGGPVSELTRQGMEDVKSKSGACWTYKILKISVSGRDILFMTEGKMN